MLVRCMTWNMCNWGKRENDPDEVARYQAAVATVREVRPHKFFGQELFVPAGVSAQAVVDRFAAAAGMDSAVGVVGNHSRLGLCIAWRHPVQRTPGVVRVHTTDVLWHALLGVTLRIDGIGVDCWVFHGAPRVGRDEGLVEAERVEEARFVAGKVTGEGANPYAVICADWNWPPADRLDDGPWWHPDPAFPPGLTPAMERLAASRAPGEVLVRAGLASAAATLRKPLEATSTGHPSPMKGTDYGRRLIDEGLVTDRLAAALVDHWVVDTEITRATSDHLPVIFTYETSKLAGGEDHGPGTRQPQ